MKVRILLAAVAAVSCGLTMAQDSGFSAGLDLQLPMGDYGEMFSLGVGPAVAYDREAGDKGLLGLTAGYSVLMAKEETITGGSSFYLQAHYKYFFSDIREGLYVAPMLGWGMVGYKYEFEIPGLISASGNTSLGGLSIGAGVGFVVNERIDLGLRWQSIRATEDGDATASSGEASVGLSSIGLRAMYNF